MCTLFHTCDYPPLGCLGLDHPPIDGSELAKELSTATRVDPSNELDPTPKLASLDSQGGETG